MQTIDLGGLLPDGSETGAAAGAIAVATRRQGLCMGATCFAKLVNAAPIYKFYDIFVYHV